MKNFIILLVLTCTLILTGCASSSIDGYPKTKVFYDNAIGRSPGIVQSYHRESIPFLEWENLCSEKKSIVGTWEGKTFKGKKVIYTFQANGKCRWNIEDRAIKGHYEITEEDTFFRIKMDRFNNQALKGVKLYGIYKLKDQEMLFYGVTVEDEEDLSRLPDSFGANSILLARKQ